MNYSYLDISKMIDHALLSPSMTDAELEAGCALCSEYQVATVCIKPYAVKSAVTWLAGSDVAVGTVIGFPHGSASTVIKQAEASQALEDGARELDMVINIGKALGSEWDFVAKDIRAVTHAAHEAGARIKVIFENDYIASEAVKIQLCRICGDEGVDWVKTSTGYGFVKQASGHFLSEGATEDDLRLMRQHSPTHIQVKASGGVRNLDALLLARELGASRIGTSSTKHILEECRKRLSTDSSPSRQGQLGGGY